MQVFYARADSLRGDPLVALAMEQTHKIKWGRSLKGIAETLQRAGDVSRLALGTYGNSAREPSAVAVATGRFDEEAFRKALESAQTPFVESTYGKRDYLTCGRGDARSYVCFLSPNVVVAASSEKLLKQTLDIRDGKRKSLERDRTFEPLLKSFSPDLDLWATGIFPADIAAALGSQLQSPAVQMIQGFTVKLSGTGDKKRLDVALHCASPDAAQANGMILKTLLGSVVTQIRLAGYEIDDLLKAINRSRIVVDGTKTDFQLEMSKKEIAATATAFRNGPTSMVVETLPPPPAAPPIPPSR